MYQHLHGSKWIDNGHHVMAACDRNGKFTYEAYNLMDRTGDHPMNEAPAKFKKALEIAIEEARKEALEKLAYAKARLRNTKIENLEFAFLVTWGLGGHTIHCDESPDSWGSTISGYGLTNEELAEIDRLGIPYVDKRKVPEDLLVPGAYRSPMTPGKPDRFDPPPYHSISYCPVEVYAAYWKALGADVRNVECDPDFESKLGDVQRELIKKARNHELACEVR